MPAIALQPQAPHKSASTGSADRRCMDLPLAPMGWASRPRLVRSQRLSQPVEADTNTRARSRETAPVRTGGRLARRTMRTVGLGAIAILGVLLGAPGCNALAGIREGLDRRCSAMQDCAVEVPECRTVTACVA